MPDQEKHVPRTVKRERLALALQKNHNLKWPLLQVNLAEDLIVGPFDFSIRNPPAYLQDGPPEPDHIANAHWNILEDRAHEFHIDTSNLRTVPQIQHNLQLILSSPLTPTNNSSHQQQNQAIFFKLFCFCRSGS